MTEYAFSVFAICLVSGLCGLLCYGSGTCEKIVLGIVTIYVILTPFAESVGSFDLDSLTEGINPPEISIENGYISVAEETFAKGICSAVAEKFSLNKENIRVRISGFDFKKMKAENIQIYLSGKGVLGDYRGIESYVNSLEMGECQVEIELG